jgi:hypothetical protein
MRRMGALSPTMLTGPRVPETASRRRPTSYLSCRCCTPRATASASTSSVIGLVMKS